MASRHLGRRVLIGAALALLVAALIGLGLYRIALLRLHERIVAALGEGSAVGRIELGLREVTLYDIHVKAPAGFPAEQELSAERITIRPDPTSLWRHTDFIASHIDIDGAYIPVWRTRSGRVSVVPSLLEPGAGPAPQVPRADLANSAARPPAAPGQTAIEVGELEIHELQVEIFDSQVGSPPHQIVLEHAHLTLGPLHHPLLPGHVDLMVEAKIRGALPNRPEGDFSLSGWLDPSAGDSDLVCRLSGVDLLNFQPYLLRATERGAREGLFGLDVHAQVANHELNATGSLALDHLVMAPGDGGLLSTFMGVPREAVVAGLKDHDGRIVLHFTLAGNVSDPHFSLQEGFALQAATGLASVLGVSVAGVAKSVGTVGSTGIRAGEEVVKGVGNVLERVGHH
jgi:hypothetical protein